jgi:DNA polymerase III epsilon subunit-like protein
MIVVDIETSGVDFVKCGIWQIGAVDFENPERIFIQEARIDDEDTLFTGNDKKLFDIIGKTEEQLRDKTKQSQKEMLKNFFKWCEKSKIKNFMCENPQFDVAFLEIKALKYGLKFPFSYRAYDFHSVAQLKHLQVNKKILVDGKGSAGLNFLLPFCGVKDERGFHNALEDAKLTAECFSRIFYGKNLLEQYKNQQIPEYLKQK